MYEIFDFEIIDFFFKISGIFTLCQKDSRHITSAYKILNVDTLFDCVDACVYDTSCKSVNVDKNTDPWKCELVTADRNTNNKYVTATGVHNYDTGKITLTLILNNGGTACLVSQGHVCEFTSSYISVIVETDMSICNTHRAALFYYNADLGYLMHHCSGRPVGPTEISTSGYMVIFQSTLNHVPDINYYWTTLRGDFSKFN